MKVLLLNGSSHEKGCTFTALNEVAKSIREAGIEMEIFWIGNQPVRDCIACGGESGGCIVASGTLDEAKRAPESVTAKFL